MRNILSCTRRESIDQKEINKEMLRKYLSKSYTEKNLDFCWFDSKDQVFFGPVEDYGNTKPYDTLYLMQRQQYLNNNRHGIPYFVQIAESGYNSAELVINEESIYEKTKFTDSVNGQKILIIGAGPSTNMVNIHDISKNYDQVWTCNDYRKHKTVKNLTPDLFYLSNEIYSNQEVHSFLKENKKISCAMDINVGRDPRIMNTIKQINPENNFIFSLRTFASVGVMPRLITIAALLGASSVGFVGMDGYAEDHYSKGEYESSFEGGTKKITNSNFNYRSQCREFILFWDYVVNIIDKQVQFINHGDIYEHNVSRHILNFIKKGIAQ
ncbi:MAG: hypothetical protein CMC82_00340 [Flavobacteriaceae bacterium]|nr:hypothetical protein [Flavobacteriaceae bacterium]|tara:strand:+ start:657 stop:1631 length:975 start_codon:yes stop_codon:yes gene_type:complete